MSSSVLPRSRESRGQRRPSPRYGGRLFVCRVQMFCLEKAESAMWKRIGSREQMAVLAVCADVIAPEWSSAQTAVGAAVPMSGADTAWVLTSSALVLAMTVPGLALFYGGLVRSKNVLGTIMQSFVILCLVSLLWVLGGYSLAFGPDVRGLKTLHDCPEDVLAPHQAAVKQG